MDIAIYQPYHDDLSLRHVDPMARPLDWTRNPRPALREGAIYLHVGGNLETFRASYMGVFSPKFSVKSVVPMADFVAFVRRNPGHDVYFINPFPHTPYFAFNVWDQGEIAHPGLVDLAKRCFRSTGMLPPDVFDMRHDQTTAAYCNFWIGTPEFFRFYLDHVVSLVSLVDGPLGGDLCRETPHNFGKAPYFPFIIERLFSSLLSSQNRFSALGYSFTEQQILDSCILDEQREMVRANKTVVDEWDTQGAWTPARRLKMIEDNKAVVRWYSVYFDRHNSPFNLK